MDAEKPYVLSDFIDPVIGQRCIELGLTRLEIRLLEHGFPPSEEYCRRNPRLLEYAREFFARPEIAALRNAMDASVPNPTQAKNE